MEGQYNLRSPGLYRILALQVCNALHAYYTLNRLSHRVHGCSGRAK